MRLRYNRLLRIDDELDDGEVNDWDDRLDRLGGTGGGCDVTIALLALLLLLLLLSRPVAVAASEADAA